MLNHGDPGLHNQAMMELGSQVCHPKHPICNRCPLSSKCKAHLTGRIHEFPVRMPRNPLKSRFFHYLHILCNQRILLSRREGKDIWNSLFEFPLIETLEPVSMDKLVTLDAWKEIMNGYSYHITNVSNVYRYKLTHQIIHATFYRINIHTEIPDKSKQWIRVAPEGLIEYAVPRLIERYLHDLKQGAEH
jgi:A/G-specific adenine glycosylase